MRDTISEVELSCRYVLQKLDYKFNTENMCVILNEYINQEYNKSSFKVDSSNIESLRSVRNTFSIFCFLLKIYLCSTKNVC